MPPVPRTRVSPLYLLMLFLVAIAMIVLTLAYVCMVAGIGYLTWWYATSVSLDISGVHSAKRMLGALFLYIIPYLILGLVALFMVKPFFYTPAHYPRSFSVDPRNEPDLFALIYSICDAIGAPRPREVWLDCRVNASASLRRGWLSLFSNDLALTIGMPLVSGLTTRQLAGVLAHEFGHFAQGAGMRLSYIIRSINGWFQDVALMRDHWDEKLDRWANDGERLGWSVYVFKAAQGCIWCVRRIFLGFMSCGESLSALMSRHMEYDADSYEAKIAGSTHFALTTERIRQLATAFQAAMDDAEKASRSHTLPDDLPELTAWRDRVLPEHVRQRLRKESRHQIPRWWHTHPCDADRIAAALKWQAEGVCKDERPAKNVFRNYGSLCHSVTMYYFEADMSLNLDSIEFRNITAITGERQAVEAAGKSLDGFFGAFFPLSRSRPLPNASPQEWPAAHAAMMRVRTDYAETSKRYINTRDKYLRQFIGLELLMARYPVENPGLFCLPESGIMPSQKALSATAATSAEIELTMLAYDEAAHRRMSCVLAWLDTQHEAVGSQQIRHLLVFAQRQLAAGVSQIEQSMRHIAALREALQHADLNPEPHILDRQCSALATRAQAAQDLVFAQLRGIHHPYLDNYPTILSTLKFLPAEAPQYARLMHGDSICTGVLLPLLERILGDLSAITIDAEKRLSIALDQPVELAPTIPMLSANWITPALSPT